MTGAPAGRRELTAAIAGGAVGAGLMLALAGRPWVTVTAPRTAPLPPLVHVISGSTAEPLLTALGIVGLAGVVALLATRSVGRVVVGVLLAAAGVLAATRAGAALGGITSARAESLLSGAGPVVGVPADTRVTAATHQGTVILVLIGAVLLASAGVLVVARGSRWPAMGARYDAPVEPAAGAVDGPTDDSADDSVADAVDESADGGMPDRQLWDALDRGDDPTAR